jgi:predicted nucleotidyltransferase
MDSLSRLLSSRVKAEVFRLLFAPGAGELHVREIARRAGLSEATVRQELKLLKSLQLVVARPSGNRTYYGANRGHPLFPEIRGLVAKTSGLVELLREALEGADVGVAFVFGSLAGGSEQARSDVDLMVIGSVSLRKLSERLAPVEARIGREINPHVLTPREFASRQHRREHFVTSVLGSRRIFVIGSDDVLADVLAGIEFYTPARKAEFLLANAVDDEDRRSAEVEVRRLKTPGPRVRRANSRPR